MGNFLARLHAIDYLLTETVEDASSIMLLTADGIDDPAVTRVQCAGLAVHIRDEVVRDLPESVPLTCSLAAGEQNEDLPGIFLEGTLPFVLSHGVL